MTAQELIAALSARYLDTKQMLPDELAHEAAAMLRQQAEQIEALTKMLVISDDTHQTWMKANAPRGWIDDLRIERDALKQQAQIHAMEAKTANSTIYEIYQVVSGGTGEPGNWNGAKPVREAFDLLKADAERWRKHRNRYAKDLQAELDAAIDAMKGAT